MVGVVDTFGLAAGKDFDVGFLVVAFRDTGFVKEWARYCPGDGADLHHCAHAAVQDVFLCGVDFGAEDGRGGLPSWYLELQGAILDYYVSSSVELRVGFGVNGVSADAQSAREGLGDGEVDG